MLLLSQGEGASETSMCVRYLVILKNLKQIVIQPMNCSPISNGAHREVMLDEQNLARVRSQAALLSGVEWGWVGNFPPLRGAFLDSDPRRGASGVCQFTSTARSHLPSGRNLAHLEITFHLEGTMYT